MIGKLKYYAKMAKAAVNQRGVEGLPMKYMIIIIVAAIVIGIALAMTGILSGGITASTTQINESVVHQVNASLAALNNTTG